MDTKTFPTSIVNPAESSAKTLLYSTLTGSLIGTLLSIILLFSGAGAIAAFTVGIVALVGSSVGLFAGFQSMNKRKQNSSIQSNSHGQSNTPAYGGSTPTLEKPISPSPSFEAAKTPITPPKEPPKAPQFTSPIAPIDNKTPNATLDSVSQTNAPTK